MLRFVSLVPHILSQAKGERRTLSARAFSSTSSDLKTDTPKLGRKLAAIAPQKSTEAENNHSLQAS
jgi:hypothetical protein